MRPILCLLAGLVLCVLCLAPAAIAAAQNYLSRPEYAGYNAAYRDAQRDEKPLLLLIGAQWCQPCRELRDVHDALRRHGHFAPLDLHRHGPLIAALRISATVPRLLIWYRGRWEILVGPAAIRQYAIGSRHLTPDP